MDISSQSPPQFSVFGSLAWFCPSKSNHTMPRPDSQSLPSDFSYSTLVNICQRQLHQEGERDVEVGAEIKNPPTRLALKCRPSIVCHDQHVKIVSHHTQ